MSHKVHIALLMMVKNESKRILVSLESVKKVVKTVIIYDTGSEDNTIDLIKTFCKNNNLKLLLKQGEFVDFSTSRNVSLDFADECKEANYILLLDGNDELKNGEILIEAAKHHLDDDKKTGFHISQEWLCNNEITKYFNLRFIKNRKNWRYKGSVHEYLENPSPSDNHIVRIDPRVVLFQDRKYDIEKSSARYKKDKELLLKDLEKNPEDCRTLFYLAQTCSCIGETKETFDYYMKRAKLDGFLEEKFQAYLRAGETYQKINPGDTDEAVRIFMKAFEVIERAEPLCKISEIYRNKGKWKLSYMFVKMACDLKYPKDSLLFVNKRLYEYDRWHLMGIVAYYAGYYGEGSIACKKAIETGPAKNVDISNLKFYNEKLGKV